MALIFIPGNPPQYQALSSDIDTSSSTISGAKYIGADVWISDTNTWYRTTASGVLVPIYTSASPVATVTVSSVAGNVTTVYPVQNVDVTYNGQIYISSSSIAVSGSTLSATNANGFILKSSPNNGSAVVIWIYGTSGSISGSAGGFPLSINESMVFSASALAKMNYAITNGTSACLCWIKA